VADAPSEFLSQLLEALGTHWTLQEGKEAAKIRFHRLSGEWWSLAGTQAGREEAKRHNLEALEVFLLRQKDELKLLTSSDPTIQLLNYIHDMVRDEIRRGLFAAM
jgi:hypothetical protein